MVKLGGDHESPEWLTLYCRLGSLSPGEEPDNELLGRVLACIAGGKYAEALVEDGVFCVISDNAPMMAWTVGFLLPSRNLETCVDFVRAHLPEALIDLEINPKNCAATIFSSEGSTFAATTNREDGRICLAILQAALGVRNTQ